MLVETQIKSLLKSVKINPDEYNVLYKKFLQYHDKLIWSFNEKTREGTWRVAHLINQGVITQNYDMIDSELQFLLG